MERGCMFYDVTGVVVMLSRLACDGDGKRVKREWETAGKHDARGQCEGEIDL